MSVKKSRPGSKSVGTRQQKSKTLGATGIGKETEAKAPANAEKVADSESLKTLSARASMKVASEKAEAARSQDQLTAAQNPEPRNDEPAPIKKLPSRRVWPD